MRAQQVVPAGLSSSLRTSVSPVVILITVRPLPYPLSVCPHIRYFSLLVRNMDNEMQGNCGADKAHKAHRGIYNVEEEQ